MRTSHPPGHIGSDILMGTVLGTASAVIGLDLHNTSAIAAGALHQRC